MNLKEIGTEFTMPMKREGTYHVQFPPEDYLCLVAGVKLDSAGSRFEHENICARIPRVYEFKHYHPNRGKWWSDKGGIDLYFIIPKERIEMVEEVGYSYPKIRIEDQTYTLNVSGGTFPEGDWTDTVRQGSHIGVGHTKKSLRNLAENATSPRVAKMRGIELIVPELEREERFRELCLKKAVQKALAPGMNIMIHKNRYYDVPGNHGPFPIETLQRKRRRVYARDRGWRVRIQYADIDWTATAEENEIEADIPGAFNRIGEITKKKAG